MLGRFSGSVILVAESTDGAGRERRPALPPGAAEKAREIAEAAPVGTPAQQAWIREIIYGSLPEAPAASMEPPVPRQRARGRAPDRALTRSEPTAADSLQASAAEPTGTAALGMTVAEMLALPVSVDLETAGRAFGFGRTKSHELARADEFPCAVKRFGNRYVVLRADLLPALGYDPALASGSGTASPGSKPDCPSGDTAAATQSMTIDELLALPVTFGIKTAARALGIGENRARGMATAGTFPVPVRQDGSRYLVIRPDLFRFFGLDPILVTGDHPPVADMVMSPLIPRQENGRQPEGPSGEMVRTLYDALIAAARVLADHRPGERT